MYDFIENIKASFQKPLPGREAQLQMAPLSRQRKMSPPDNARQAAVLATFFPKNEEWHLLFIQRNMNDKDRHGGQISFPGGKVEAEDESNLHTALRETEEEVGIPRNHVNVLGGLSELYIPVSNFQVYPYVGFLEKQPEYELQLAEVSGILEVPFSHLLKKETRRFTDLPINKALTMKNVPYFDIHGQVLWGATAMMLNELVEIASPMPVHR